jgi:hypothetical protein
MSFKEERVPEALPRRPWRAEDADEEAMPRFNKNDIFFSFFFEFLFQNEPMVVFKYLYYRNIYI